MGLYVDVPDGLSALYDVVLEREGELFLADRHLIDKIAFGFISSSYLAVRWLRSAGAKKSDFAFSAIRVFQFKVEQATDDLLFTTDIMGCDIDDEKDIAGIRFFIVIASGGLG
jgi:hypothetical protein